MQAIPKVRELGMHPQQNTRGFIVPVAIKPLAGQPAGRVAPAGE